MKKSLKNVEKYLQYQFWKIRQAQNIKKITPNEVGDQCIYFTYIFYYFKNATPFKSMSNKVVISFYSIFAPIQLIKGLIFDLSKLDLSSIWLFDTFNIPFLYIDY